MRLGAALAAAFAFLGPAWRSAGPWLVAAWLICAAALQWAGAWWLAALVAIALARVMLWRSRVADKAAFAVTFGRLGAVWGLGALFLAILSSVVLVVFLACAYAVASAGPLFDAREVASWAPAIDARGRTVLGIVAAIALAAWAGALSRIGLAEPASLARGKVQVLSSFALTRGRAVDLTLGRLLLAGPAIVLACMSWRGRVFAGLEALLIAGLFLPADVGFIAHQYETGIQKP